MKIVRYRSAGAVRWGVLDGGQVLAARGEPFRDLEPTDPVGPIDAVALAAPVVPGKIVCVGRNYRAHAEEFGSDVPAEPLLFWKPPSAVIGPDEEIVYPSLSRRVDPEAELALVIGARTHRVQAADGWSAIGGYTCGNDVTARDLQRSDGQWTRGKGFHTFCPLGPWVETDFDPTDVRVTCTVDGEPRQDGRTSALIFAIPYLIEYISRFTVLEPGDVVMTGTPEGVRPIAVGQTVTVEVEGLGALSNTVVAEP